MLLFFYYKIDSLEEYSLAKDITTSFTCFMPNITQENLVFVFFSTVEDPVNPRMTKSRKILDKQEIDFEKHWVLARKIDDFQP